MDNDNTTSKPEGKPLSGNKKKPASVPASFYVEQLAMAMGEVLPPERIILYSKALSDLTSEQLAYGFDCALKYFKAEYGVKFPYPAQVREWALQWTAPVIDDAKRLLERGDKPPDWDPDYAKKFLDEMKKAVHAFPPTTRDE